jgi:hypothetical protein
VYALDDSSGDSRVAKQSRYYAFWQTKLSPGTDHCSVTLNQADFSQQFASVKSRILGRHSVASRDDPGMIQASHYPMCK